MSELVFHHPFFEESIREELNIHDRPITTDDAKRVELLECSLFRMDREDMETLRWFRNAKIAYLETAEDDILPLLNTMRQLEVLDITLLCSTADLIQIADLTRLTHFCISGGDLSSMQILHLNTLVRMKNLHDLCLHEVGHVDLKPLESLPQLTMFFCGYADQIDNLHSIAKLPNLEELCLHGVEIPSLDFLDDLPDTVCLDLCGVTVQQEYDLNKFKRFAQYNLSELIIAGRRVLPEDLLHEKELYQACCELPCDFQKIKNLLETNRCKPNELMQVACCFVEQKCFCELRDFYHQHARSPQTDEMHSQNLYRLLSLFLEFGLDPNLFDNGNNVMLGLNYMDYGCVAADCLRLLMEHGADPNLIREDNADIEPEQYALHESEYISERYHSRVHHWLVKLGYGACSSDGTKSVQMKNGHSIEELRMHEQFGYTIEELPEQNGKWIIHIIRKDTGEEVAAF